MSTFDHERLDVYKASIEWVVVSDNIAPAPATGQSLFGRPASTGSDLCTPQHRRRSWRVQQKGEGPLLQDGSSVRNRMCCHTGCLQVFEFDH